MKQLFNHDGEHKLKLAFKREVAMDRFSNFIWYTLLVSKNDNIYRQIQPKVYEFTNSYEIHQI